MLAVPMATAGSRVGERARSGRRSMSPALRGPRRLKRVRAAEGIVLQAGVDDACNGRVGREVHVEQLGTDRVTDQADVRHGNAVAVAEATGLRVATEMGLERRE